MDPRLIVVHTTWRPRIEVALAYTRTLIPDLMSEYEWDTGMQNLTLSVKINDKLYSVRMNRWLDGQWSRHHMWNGETTWDQALASHKGDISKAMSCLFVYCFHLAQQ